MAGKEKDLSAAFCSCEEEREEGFCAGIVELCERLVEEDGEGLAAAAEKIGEGETKGEVHTVVSSPAEGIRRVTLPALLGRDREFLSRRPRRS